MAVSGFMRQFRRCFARGVDPYWVELLPGGKVMDFDSIPVVGPNVGCSYANNDGGLTWNIKRFPREVSRRNFREVYRNKCKEIINRFLGDLGVGNHRYAVCLYAEEYKTLKIHEAYARWYKEHGYVVREVFNSGGSCLHLYHEHDISAVYRNAGEMPIRASHQVIARYRRARPYAFPSVGLGASMGTEWRELRNMLPSMSEPYKILKGELEEVTDDLIDALKLNMDENGEIDLIQWLYRWAYESFGVFALRKRLGAFTPHGRQEADLMIQAADMTNEIIFLTTCDVGDCEKEYNRLIPVQDFYCRTLDKYITEFEMDENFCLLKLMMDKNRDHRRDIIAVLQDLFQGAMHTAATTIGVALYHVARHGSTQQEAHEDLKKALPSKDSRFSEMEGYGKITSIYGIIEETLRLNPPTIGNGRITDKECVLGGYSVPKGTMAVLQTQVACRLEQNFERPLEFIPERHTRLKSTMMNNFNLIEPFGKGRRSCPGSLFARNQMYMAVSKILRNFEISYHHEDIVFINKLNNLPEKPVMMRLKPLED